MTKKTGASLARHRSKQGIGTPPVAPMPQNVRSELEALLRKCRRVGGPDELVLEDRLRSVLEAHPTLPPHERIH